VKKMRLDKNLEHFQAKWTPVRVKKMRRNKNIEFPPESGGAGKAPADATIRSRSLIDHSERNRIQSLVDIGRLAVVVRTKGAACLALALCLAAAPLARCENLSPPARADTYVDRLEALALIEMLNADLLASRSATRTLEAWCADHHMAAEPKVHAHLIAGAFKEISAESRQRLAIGAETPVKYRRVELRCGDHILSQADNWYVPERLTPEMNRILETTDQPFGTVVKDLAPHRQTIAAKRLWQPLPAGWELAPPPLDQPAVSLDVPVYFFEHRAILIKPDGQAFSEVIETYRRDILDFARTPR
jgi:chorismate-pyruvate lyase